MHNARLEPRSSPAAARSPTSSSVSAISSATTTRPRKAAVQPHHDARRLGQDRKIAITCANPPSGARSNCCRDFRCARYIGRRLARTRCAKREPGFTPGTGKRRLCFADLDRAGELFRESCDIPAIDDRTGGGMVLAGRPRTRTNHVATYAMSSRIRRSRVVLAPHLGSWETWRSGLASLRHHHVQAAQEPRRRLRARGARARRQPVPTKSAACASCWSA